MSVWAQCTIPLVAQMPEAPSNKPEHISGNISGTGVVTADMCWGEILFAACSLCDSNNRTQVAVVNQVFLARADETYSVV
jgi:hypothetical protein